MRWILASSSPRRRQLLEQAGLSFQVVAPGTDETLLPGESPERAVVRLARDKARAVAAFHPGFAVIAADTAVVLDGSFLGKPMDAGDAVHMLRSLSGRAHEVMTGYALATHREIREGLCVTRVVFRDLREEEIQAYVSTGEPLDKAGGYGIQSGAAHMVREIHGSYTNVVGLPMAEVMERYQSMETEAAKRRSE